MNFTVNVNKFRNHVAMVTPVIGKSFLPIMNNILIEADGENIVVCAGNAAQMISSSFECSSTPGAVTVPARKLLSLLASLPQDEDVAFDSDDAKALVTLTVPAGVFTLLGSPAMDYPRMEFADREKVVILAEGVLSAMIEHCKNAVSKDTSRPALAGVYLHFQPDSTTAVATDGKRMAVYSVPAENDSSVHPVIIPSAALGFISKVSGDVELTASDSMLKVKGNNMTVITKLIAGSYPNYRTVIPPTFKENVEVDGALLASAIKLVTPVVEANQSITLAFKEDCIELAATNSSIGTANYRIPVERGTSQPCEVSLNPAFILNALNGSEEKVKVQINDTLSPMSITVCDEVFTIIMPLRRK
jgi:DNA polymerase-3 subunit beta